MKTYLINPDRSALLALFTATAMLLAAAGLAEAQQPVSTTVDRNFKRKSIQDVESFAQVRLLAERGNAQAQLKVADAYFENRLSKTSLEWYIAAADQGVPEAAYKVGHILLFGARGNTPEEGVAAKPLKGLPYAYAAATNHHPLACYDMGQAVRDGLGCASNFVVAYVWFTGCPEAKGELKDLTLKMTPSDISTALARARELKAGRCPDLNVVAQEKACVAVDINLKLGGISYSRVPRSRFAIINNRTMGEGEAVEFYDHNKNPVAVTCVHIAQYEVDVQVAGESGQRTLSAAPDLAYGSR